MDHSIYDIYLKNLANGNTNININKL